MAQRRACPHQETLCGLFFQCQTLSPENTHTGSVIQTEQVIFGNMYVYTYTCMHAITIRKNKAINLKESWEECMGSFEGM